MNATQIAQIISQEFGVDCAATANSFWWVPPIELSKPDFDALASQITERIIELDNQSEDDYIQSHAW